MALMDFTYRLSAWNYSADVGGIADEEITTRQEAKLLMSLLSCPIRVETAEQPQALGEPVSVSESDRSFASSASDSSWSSRREYFTFTCPSLSLENSNTAPSLPLPRTNTTPRRVSDSSEESSFGNSTAEETPRPAKLLGRQLMVDDRDALRLSADAMARNVRHSFQKAIGWRIQSWTHALSKKLVKKEQDMKRSGASEQELRTLLQSSEANLILQLNAVKDHIKVTATGTSFQVLSEVDHQQEPLRKKQRMGSTNGVLADTNTHYSNSYLLLMDCVVSLQTPAGFSEITLQVPGTIEGTFLHTETGMEELQSVVVDIDTDILAAMVEKSCRTIVRTSVEATCQPPSEDTNATITDTAQPETTDEPTVQPSSVQEVKTPLSAPPTSVVSAKEVRVALVTPRTLFSDPNHDSDKDSPKPVLMPIPDNFDEGTQYGPRRISPHSHLPSAFNSSFTPRTPHPTDRMSMSPPMISPPLNENGPDFEDDAGKGPSLPMLVEAACRAMDRK